MKSMIVLLTAPICKVFTTYIFTRVTNDDSDVCVQIEIK